MAYGMVDSFSTDSKHTPKDENPENQDVSSDLEGELSISKSLSIQKPSDLISPGLVSPGFVYPEEKKKNDQYDLQTEIKFETPELLNERKKLAKLLTQIRASKEHIEKEKKKVSLLLHGQIANPLEINIPKTSSIADNLAKQVATDKCMTTEKNQIASQSSLMDCKIPIAELNTDQIKQYEYYFPYNNFEKVA